MSGIRIGVLAQRTGTTTPTIRYYEDVGLLPRATRQAGGQRRYGESDVARLLLIRRCREFGFPVEQVQALLALFQDPERDCGEARDLAFEHLTAIREKLAELHHLERSISELVERCDAACAGGPAPRCTVLEDLSQT